MKIVSIELTADGFYRVKIQFKGKSSEALFEKKPTPEYIRQVWLQGGFDF